MWCAPGNAGIGGETLAANGSAVECVGIGAEDLPALLAFARDNQADLTVVGPDNPLAMGIVDQFQAAGLRAWGPTQQASQFESSKIFSQEFMDRNGIPTMQSASFADAAEAKAFAASLDGQCAVKADGLALGKGVLICNNNDEAIGAIDQIMTDRAFGEAGADLHRPPPDGLKRLVVAQPRVRTALADALFAFRSLLGLLGGFEPKTAWTYYREDEPSLARHSLNYSLVPIVHKVLAVAMLAFYTAWLHEAEYGAVFVTDLILVVLAEFFGAHLLNGMLRFYFEHEDERKRKAVVSSTTILVAVLAWTVCGIGYLFRDTLTPILLGRGDDIVGPERLTQLLVLALLILPLALSSQSGFHYLQIL